jgi:hypothetical protein
MVLCAGSFACSGPVIISSSHLVAVMSRAWFVGCRAMLSLKKMHAISHINAKVFCASDYLTVMGVMSLNMSSLTICL